MMTTEFKITDKVKLTCTFVLDQPNHKDLELPEGTVVEIYDLLKNTETGHLYHYVVQYGGKRFWVDENEVEAITDASQ